jgi:excinuclease ABC subunit C
MNDALSTQNDLDPESLRLHLPDGPGVYLFKDHSDRVIYVGKAKSLKKRVLSYFKPSQELPYKTALMMTRAEGLEFIVTATEKEAFILESNLVKKLMPRYNIVLRDDKQYPCLRLDIEEPYPRLTIVRRIRKDGALYFGPFSSANGVRSTLRLIHQIFQIRECKGKSLPTRSRPCLNYQLGRCLGACAHEVSSSSYKEVVNQVRLFLEGRNRELIKQLEQNMQEASEDLNFEKAARVRDQIKAVENTIERQNVVSPKMEDQDVIGLAQTNGVFQLAILFVRKGYLLGSRDYVFRDKGGTSSEVMEAFLKQYYSRELFIPKHILISEPVEDLIPIKEWISDLAKKKVLIHHPQRGEKRRLVRMAKANAENLLNIRTLKHEDDLVEMARSVLKLKNIPRSVEGLDISNLYGGMAVGTVVSFMDGQPNKSGYRNYKIKGVEGIDDYGMMSELVSRRLSGGNPPDLFVVDGGKGHLMAVVKVMENFPGMEMPDAVAIAKPDEKERHEKIYIPGRRNPLSLLSDHPVLLLLMRVRDEAHRRAITYHRKLRAKSMKESELDLIPGVGARRKQLLLEHFGEVRAIADAKLEDVLRVPGISSTLGESILKFLNQKNHQK